MKAPCKSNQQMFVEEVFIATSVYSADLFGQNLEHSNDCHEEHRKAQNEQREEQWEAKTGQRRAPVKATDTWAKNNTKAFTLLIYRHSAIG